MNRENELEKIVDPANDPILTNLIGEGIYVQHNGYQYNTVPMLVVQVQGSQISSEMFSYLEDNPSFVDADPSLDEFMISPSSLDDLIIEFEENRMTELYNEAIALKAVMGKNYSYMHITLV